MFANWAALKRAGLCALICVCFPALAAPAALAMLDELTPGMWELRDRGGKVVQRICVANARQLLQLRHPGPSCKTYVVDDKPNLVTVQYSCEGRGHGRTQIRRETNRLIQIESQGIADGLPFDILAEGRRVAAC